MCRGIRLQVRCAERVLQNVNMPPLWGMMTILSIRTKLFLKWIHTYENMHTDTSVFSLFVSLIESWEAARCYRTHEDRPQSPPVAARAWGSSLLPPACTVKGKGTAWSLTPHSSSCQSSSPVNPHLTSSIPSWWCYSVLAALAASSLRASLAQSAGLSFHSFSHLLTVFPAGWHFGRGWRVLESVDRCWHFS